MKYIMILLCCLGFIGCETIPTSRNMKGNHKTTTTARITWYCAKEDKRFRNKIAATTKFRAKEGRTVAVSPREIPYWTLIHIPFLNKMFKNGGWFTAEDTGSAVRSRKASHGKYPVIDVFVDSYSKMKLLAATVPPYLDIEY